MDSETPPEGTFARLQHQSGSTRRDRPHPPKRPQVRSNDRTSGRTDDRSTKRPDVRATESTLYTIQVPEDRQQVRHAFNIFRDQYLALQKLQMALADTDRDRPQLGHMVQQAIDLYIQRTVKRLSNVRLTKTPKR